MVNNILRFLRRFFRAQEAVSALEYAILVGVIVAGVGAALLVFSDNIEKAIERHRQARWRPCRTRRKLPPIWSKAAVTSS